MYLSRLNAFGFKSFAQKLDLKLEDGIVAVVGPNGCGKSNVVDAIRWCMGEQRARALRSSHMEDVIFQGSRSRKPLGLAEVSVTIDNSQRLLPLEFTEVTVTRRLYRSGESEYLINKIPCLLRDIQNLLMDTGMGAHAYSVIEQGMVDEIISDKTEERRRVFEEAAGVTRYKVRRRSAWNKLQSIQQDLTRIDDIIGEVERQVASLARQERKARLYKQLTDGLQTLEMEVARFRYFEMSDRSRPMLDEMSFLKEDIEVGTTHSARLEARLEEIRAEVAEQDQALAAANAEVSRQVGLVHEKDRVVLVSREEIRGIDGFLVRADRQAEELAERRAIAIAGSESARVDATQAADRLSVVTTDVEREGAALEALGARGDEHRSRAQEEQSRSRALMQEINSRSSALERSKAEVEGLGERRARLVEDVQRVARRRSEANGVLEEAGEEIVSLETRLVQAQQDRATLARDRKDGQVRGDALVESRVKLRGHLEADRARLSLLKKLEEQFDGYSKGVQALAADGSPFAERIRAILADLVGVDAKYARAIEAALGRSLDCLVVDSADDAIEAMAYLREGDHGGAGFLPADRIPQASGAPWSPPDADGLVGRASDLIKPQGDDLGATVGLLRNTFVVRDTATALEWYPRFRARGCTCVTLDGEIFSVDGTIFGGVSGHSETSLIGRHQQIEVLTGTVVASETELSELEQRIREAVAQLGVDTERLEAADGALADLKHRLAVRQRDDQNAQAEVERQDRTARELTEEHERLDGRVLTFERSLAEGQILLRSLESRRLVREETERAIAQIVSNVERQRSELNERVSAHRVEVASLEERSERLRQEADWLSQEAEKLEAERSGLTKESEENRARRGLLEAAMATASEELQSLHARQKEEEGKRDRKAESQQELMMMSRGVEEELREKSRKVAKSRERLHELEIGLAELKTRAEELHSRILTEREVDLKEIGRLDDPEFNADISAKKVVEIQERLRRMGPVNLAALEEYEVQKERYEFLAKQRDDLLEAEDTLKRTIQKIDRTARARFLETYGKIRENFRITYAKFFEGGEADLFMATDEDPLEAAIQITARPRGKRLQNISLLSGGERALTAIALLFAIYLVKPSPYCILDEVDAPLDDANVNRFVRVIREFSKDTQFLIVTHNKGTMEAADSLHGVTMEEPGVSKLVSVRLGEQENESKTSSRSVAAEELAADD